ncbi:ABC transporter ATP-binding protein, partial [Streptomyces sp. SID6013]|nr:ABC transporter ATP-binding protein [Streptomyces sp. SID6013]
LFSEMPKYVMIARASAERMALVLTAPPVTTPGRERPAGGTGLEVDCVRHGTLRKVRFRVSAGEFVAVAAYQPRAAADLAAVLALNVPPDAYEGTVRVGGRDVADLA